MNELALFAGAGGGLLATTHLLGWRTVAAVEIDPYRREVLLRRQRDGVLDLFPIWDDIRTFHAPWFGEIVDIITAGFPCQPHSTASHGRSGPDYLWRETIRVIGDIKPENVFLENVPGAKKFFTKVREDLCGCGYTTIKTTTIGASDAGAPHHRKRIWLLANSNEGRKPSGSLNDEAQIMQETQKSDWWCSNPADFVGVDDGVANRLDRLRALGDGQVPAVVALAWKYLKGEIDNG
jgi:DNA (cytosine-5)-methyltransferase 1